MATSEWIPDQLIDLSSLPNMGLAIRVLGLCRDQILEVPLSETQPIEAVCIPPTILYKFD